MPPVRRLSFRGRGVLEAGQASPVDLPQGAASRSGRGFGKHALARASQVLEMKHPFAVPARLSPDLATALTGITTVRYRPPTPTQHLTIDDARQIARGTSP